MRQIRLDLLKALLKRPEEWYNFGWLLEHYEKMKNQLRYVLMELLDEELFRATIEDFVIVLQAIIG